MEGFKKFLVKVLEWKTWTCVMFTAAIIIYGVLAFLSGEQGISMFTLLGLLIVSALCSFIQYLCFTENIIKKMKYSMRSLLFVVLFLPTLAACGYVFKWLPTGNIWGWVLFMVIFILCFVAFTLCFEIYFKFTGRKYDGLLGQFKKHQEEKNK